jgi:hypothetical protein
MRTSQSRKSQNTSNRFERISIKTFPGLNTTVMKYMVTVVALPHAIFAGVALNDDIGANGTFVTAHVRVFPLRGIIMTYFPFSISSQIRSPKSGRVD